MVSWQIAMTLKITTYNQLTALKFHLIGTVIMAVTLYLLRLDHAAIMIFSLFWLAYFVPAIYLHLEYYFKNYGQRLEISEHGMILYDRNGEVRSYSTTDLDKIVIYKSASLDKKGIPLTPMEFYHYALIVPKKGTEITLTCLMAPNVEQVLRVIKGVSFERKKRLFASLNFSLHLLPDK
jgi:hypothetical protein